MLLLFTPPPQITDLRELFVTPEEPQEVLIVVTTVGERINAKALLLGRTVGGRLGNCLQNLWGFLPALLLTKQRELPLNVSKEGNEECVGGRDFGRGKKNR